MRNPVYEQALDKQGVKWHYKDKVPLADIDASKGLRNQARLDTPLDEDLVAAYTKALREGSEFPPLVLWRSGAGKYMVLDGNQRLAAYGKAKRAHADAYAVETEDQMVVDRLCWSFNNLVNGKRLTAEECAQHAVTMVRKYGVTQKDAAKEWGLSLSKMSWLIRGLEIREALDRQNVKHSGIADSTVVRLCPLLDVGEDVLARAAEAAAKTGMTDEQAIEMVARAKAAKTQEAKLKAIDDFVGTADVVARQAETKGGTTSAKVLPRDRLSSLVGQVARLLDSAKDLSALRPSTGAKAAAFAEDAGVVLEKLAVVAQISQPPKRKRRSV